MKPMDSQAKMLQMPESQTTMLLPADAFAHVPMLAGKILEPEKSMFRISRDTFREWDRRAQEAGYGENWRRTHEEREETRSKALAGRLDRDLWIFAYGSLMWDPALHSSISGRPRLAVSTGASASKSRSAGDRKINPPSWRPSTKAANARGWHFLSRRMPWIGRPRSCG